MIAMPLMAIEVSVGLGNQQALIPVNMYYRNNLFETIYYSTEMNTVGQITAIRFYNNFYENLLNKPTNIWLGNTLLSNLSGGWIPSTSLTQVFSGNVNYPSGENTISITLDTPFFYNGNNLIMMVQRPWEEDYYMPMNYFKAQTVGTDRSLSTYNHNTVIDPANPPTTGVTGQFPMTTFEISAMGYGSLTGFINAGGQALEGATVSIENTVHSTTTGIDGSYSFSAIAAGTYSVRATKMGYTSANNAVGISEGDQSIQNFVLEALPQVLLSGRVVGYDDPDLGIAGASITLSGHASYTAITDGNGIFALSGVYGNQIYNFSINAEGYQALAGQWHVNADDIYLGDISLSEIAYSPMNLMAELANGYDYVALNWDAPVTAEEGWLHYDNGINYNSWGTGGSANFEVAIRFTASVLADYAGTSLQALKIWPSTGGNFSLRVWTGGDINGPAALVVDQQIIPVLNTYNTIMLDIPYLITGNEDLWFGFLCDVTGVNPAYAGFDEGPAVNGFGNMIRFQNTWQTLLSLNSFLDFNWNIQAYAGFVPPGDMQDLIPLRAQKFAAPEVRTNRELLGYKVSRLLQGQEYNPQLWTNLTPQTITATAFADTAWPVLSAGYYLWAVQSVYSGNVLSAPAFSNVLHKQDPLGTIAGIVRSGTNQAISGATVVCGSVEATTNASGTYSMMVESGLYTVTASKQGFAPNTWYNVHVVAGQITTVNFVLEELTMPLDDDFESYPDFAMEFGTWTLHDIDMSETSGINGFTWQNINLPMAFMVFNPSATTPPLIGLHAHSGDKMLASFAAENPPNNDWLVSHLVNIEANQSLYFWARSYSESGGLERFKVGVSTGSTYPPASFNIVSGPGYVLAPSQWTRYAYDLSAYVGQNIRIGIACYSNDGTAFFVDDVKVAFTVDNDDLLQLPMETSLKENYPNPFNPETTISYYLHETSDVLISVYNLKGQAVRTLVSGCLPAGMHNVLWNGTDASGKKVSSGVYYYRMTTGKYSATRKMILMK